MPPKVQHDVSQDKLYFVISLICHIGILLLLILGFDVTTPMAVIQNTNQHDVISAVVLGDTPKSKILTDESANPPPVPEVKPVAKEEPPPPPPAPVVKTEPKDDTIALEAARKKKLAEQKALEEKKRREELEKKLMADILQETKKTKKVRQKKLASKYQKKLREQAEQSLRQQLLDEEIKLKGTQARMAQGEVDKYKALIIQAISEHWIVPIQANKKLYSVLLIRVAPGGMVLDVQITKSSGDPSLDSSARVAVMKASPLPVPTDPDAFESFRQFVLKVKPENVINNDGGLGA